MKTLNVTSCIWTDGRRSGCKLGYSCFGIWEDGHPFYRCKHYCSRTDPHGAMKQLYQNVKVGRRVLNGCRRKILRNFEALRPNLIPF